MKKLCFYVVIFVVAALFSGCGQPTPPGKGGDGSDSGKQAENTEKRIYWFDDNTRTETKMGIVYSVNLGYKDKRQELEIKYLKLRSWTWIYQQASPGFLHTQE